jgi:hypothetical protein
LIDTSATSVPLSSAPPGVTLSADAGAAPTDNSAMNDTVAALSR